uniref:Sushi domain containing 5 n=1 Tax=Mastacembelus armatus TaxID=205130 RepID=A0A3Q3LUK2_9TELE
MRGKKNFQVFLLHPAPSVFSGRVFVLDLRNSFREAEQACASRHAHLASAEELRRAVMECFFSSCTRGWLHGGIVGTTVCNTVGSALKAVDVRTENATEDPAHLDAFCIKDKDTPCGDPPSFPNARLQGHTGLGMGDELLYTCEPGYMMPSGQSSFSLLCDSCGEWYGLVQIYSHGGEKHNNERPEEAHGQVKLDGAVEEGEKGEERAVEDFISRPRWEKERKEVVRTSAAAATEAPVSLLSQKHMFWFPSEAFPSDANPVTQTMQRASGDNHEHDDHDNYDDHDSHEDDADGHVIFSIATDETWLDGYPVVPEETSKGDSTRERVRPEDRERVTDVRATDRPNEIEIRRPVPYTRLPEEPESHSPSYSDTLDYDTQQAAPTHSWLGDLTEHPFLDHAPAPPVHDSDILTGTMGEHPVRHLPGEAGERGEVEGEKGEAICTGENCPPHPPSSTSQGPTVAAVIVAMCVIVAAVITGVWCYRRQQQKSSVYEMNGKGQCQSRQGQQIEMQQKV